MTVSFVCAQSCPTLCKPMNCSPPGSSVHVISQARILEWVAISFTGSSRPRDWTHVSCIVGGFLTTELSGKSSDTEGISMVEKLENHAPTWWEFCKNICTCIIFKNLFLFFLLYGLFLVRNTLFPFSFGRTPCSRGGISKYCFLHWKLLFTPASNQQGLGSLWNNHPTTHTHTHLPDTLSPLSLLDIDLESTTYIVHFYTFYKMSCF